MCLNVDDYIELCCIVLFNVEKMFDYMLLIVWKVVELIKEKFLDVFDLVFDERICNDVFESLGDDEEI